MAAIDEFMPSYEIRSQHSSWVRASPDRVYAALLEADLGRPWLVRTLMGLRVLPAALAHPRRAWQRWRTPRASRTLRTLLGADFTVLADRPGEELVMGLQGQFWRLHGGLVAVDAATFHLGPPPGLAQAVWNFRTEPERGGTRLTTETRVRTGDPLSGRRFRRYWRVVGPFSGLLRGRMLALVGREAAFRDETT